MLLTALVFKQLNYVSVILWQISALFWKSFENTVKYLVSARPPPPPPPLSTNFLEK